MMIYANTDLELPMNNYPFYLLNSYCKYDVELLMSVYGRLKKQPNSLCSFNNFYSA